MVVVKPDVIDISSDEEDDGDGVINLYEGIESQLHGDINHDAIVISSDDEDDGDGDRNLDEGPGSEHDGDYSELAGIELDKEEEDDVEKSKEEEFVDSCDKRRDRSDSLNEGGNDLQELSLYECKTYLRKHGMRVSGTKEECVQRIKEHGRLKDGSFESLYPRSSFSINCTGDACRGDVVLFKQKMYDSQRNIIGRRTVAGRVVKESYGASTQQHTFSIEVLWSKWFKELNPLSILLIKGRNLYRFGTFRQPWKSEAERSKVLREKHERGRVARHKRKLRETEFSCGDTKGTKRRKVSHRGPSQIDKHNDENNNTAADNQAVRFQNSELEKALPLTCHSEPNPSMYSNNHLQEASLPFAYDGTLLHNNLPPFSFSSYNHCNNEQGPNQALSRPPDRHHNNKPPTHRLTDGIAKSRFPKSSFSINCTGDARVGDTVLFKQHVYLGGTKIKKKRTVTGRIVNMRECGSKDKHKFLIKVLWATPSKKLHQRFTLLVRSHNLYKFGTFRQPRKNEGSKSKRFKEKHAQTKHKQKLRKTDIASNKTKGTKRQKGSHKGPSSSKQPTQIAKPKSSKRKGASANAVKETKTGHKRKAVQIQKAKVKKSKQTFQQGSKPNLNLNLNLTLSTNLNPALNTTLNPTPLMNPNPNPNPNPNKCTKGNPDKRKNRKANKRTKRNLNKCTNPNPNKLTNQNTHINRNPNLNPSLSTNLNLASNTTLNPTPWPIPNPNPSPNPNPNPSPNPNPNPNKCTKGNPKRKNRKANKFRNPNPNSNTHTNRNPNKHTNRNPNLNPSLSTNLNPASNTTLNPTPWPNPNPNPNLNKCTKGNLNKRKNRKANKFTKPKPNPNPNKLTNPNPNPNKHTNRNPNTHTNKKPNKHPTPISNPNPNLNKHPNPNSGPTTNLNTCPKPNLNLNTPPAPHPHPNSYAYHDQPQGSSTSLPHDRTLMPYLPPIGLLPNQPPVWFPPSQPPFGFSGYGGQWDPNHVFTQSPGYYDYNQMIVQGLFNLLTNLCARN